MISYFVLRFQKDLFRLSVSLVGEVGEVQLAVYSSVSSYSVVVSRSLLQALGVLVSHLLGGNHLLEALVSLRGSPYLVSLNGGLVAINDSPLDRHSAFRSLGGSFQLDGSYCSLCIKIELA